MVLKTQQEIVCFLPLALPIIIMSKVCFAQLMILFFPTIVHFRFLPRIHETR